MPKRFAGTHEATFFWRTQCSAAVTGWIWLVASNTSPKSSTHSRGQNARSKKIGQTIPKMIFVPNIYISGKISALRPRTQNVSNFGTLNKSENYLKQRDFRICFFCGFLRVLSLVKCHLRCCKDFLVFVPPSPKTCNQSPKIEDQSKIYRCFG